MDFSNELLNCEINDPLFIQMIWKVFVLLGILNHIILVVEEHITKSNKEGDELLNEYQAVSHDGEVNRGLINQNWKSSNNQSCDPVFIKIQTYL